MNNTHYSPDGFEAVYTDEGRVTPIYNDSLATLDSFQYEWVLRDHLGNGRVYFSDLDKNLGISSQTPQEVLQERHYYPFGLMFEGPFYPQVGPQNEYTYNGKRYHREGDLNWYDYGARWQDPTVARWWSLDPLSELAYDQTPFHYVLNNPVSLIDPDGRKEEDPMNVLSFKGKAAQDLFRAIQGGTNDKKEENEEEEECCPGLDRKFDRQIVSNNAVANGQDPTEAWEVYKEASGDNDLGRAFGDALVIVGSYYVGGAVVNLVLKGGRLVFIGSQTARATNGVTSKILNFSLKQLQKKFKHAKDFGVVGNYSTANAAKFSSAKNQHIGML